jgi:hypothetical protein
VQKTLGGHVKEAEVGALMYDGWTKDSIHYVGVVATFMQGHTVRKKYSTVYDVATEIVLLSVAPMERVDDDVVVTERMGNDRATSFTAKTQSDHLKKIVRFMNFNLTNGVCA